MGVNEKCHCLQVLSDVPVWLLRHFTVYGASNAEWENMIQSQAGDFTGWTCCTS